MADQDEKIYHNETIEDQPMPGEGIEAVKEGSGEAGEKIYRNQTIPDRTFPEKKVAVELIGAALNTKSRKILAEFEFTPSGALQIGKYEAGTSGDIRISPSGIVARNTTGAITFTLDGETGDAVFMGKIQTGTLISGLVIVGNNNVVIDGENKRILIYDDNGIARILLGYHENGF